MSGLAIGLVGACLVAGGLNASAGVDAATGLGVASVSVLSVMAVALFGCVNVNCNPSPPILMQETLH